MTSNINYEREVSGLVDLDDLLTNPPISEPWIVYGLVAPQRLTAIVGEAKIGKSLFALEMAVAMSNGRPFLGHPTLKTKTLYIDMENNIHSDVRERLEHMDHRPGDFGNLIYYSFPDIKPLDTEEGGQQLLDLVTRHGVECVIIDTISRVVEGEENSNDTWNRFYMKTELLLKQKKIALVRIDHTGKDVSKGARGGSAKSGDVDLTVQMFAKANGQITLQRLAGRMRAGFDRMTLKRVTEPRLHHAVILDESLLDQTGRAIALSNLLDQNGYPRGLTDKETRLALSELGERSSKELSLKVTRLRKLVSLPEEVDVEPPQSHPQQDPGSIHFWASLSDVGPNRPRHQQRQRCLQ